MPSKRQFLNLYFTDEARTRATELIRQLEQRGIMLRDQRGNTSFSALFRYLIAEELKRLATNNPNS